MGLPQRASLPINETKTEISDILLFPLLLRHCARSQGTALGCCLAGLGDELPELICCCLSHRVPGTSTVAGVQPQTRTRRRDKALPASLCTHAMGWVWVHTPRDQPALTSAPLLPEAAAAWILLSDPQNLLGPPSPRLPLTAARPGGSWQRPGCPYTTPRPHIAPRGPPHTRKPPKIPPNPPPQDPIPRQQPHSLGVSRTPGQGPLGPGAPHGPPAPRALLASTSTTQEFGPAVARSGGRGRGARPRFLAAPRPLPGAAPPHPPQPLGRHGGPRPAEAWPGFSSASLLVPGPPLCPPPLPCLTLRRAEKGEGEAAPAAAPLPVLGVPAAHLRGERGSGSRLRRAGSLTRPPGLMLLAPQVQFQHRNRSERLSE